MVVEQWKDIEENTEYAVSSFGRVFSKRNGVYLRTARDPRGGHRVSLAFNGVRQSRYVHMLVAEAFLRPKTADEVIHTDGIKSNNVVWNLEWVTHSELVTRSMAKPKPLANHILVVETGKTYESIAECSRATGGEWPAILACLKGERRSHIGLHFEIIKREGSIPWDSSNQDEDSERPPLEYVLLRRE